MRAMRLLPDQARVKESAGATEVIEDCTRDETLVKNRAIFCDLVAFIPCFSCQILNRATRREFSVFRAAMRSHAVSMPTALRN